MFCFRKPVLSSTCKSLKSYSFKTGIAGNFYNVIKNMYVDNYLSVKMRDGFTQSFMSTIGVRQGDTLSHDLFKIFINDLPDIFDISCHGVDIGTYHLN